MRYSILLDHHANGRTVRNRDGMIASGVMKRDDPVSQRLQVVRPLRWRTLQGHSRSAERRRRRPESLPRRSRGRALWSPAWMCISTTIAREAARPLPALPPALVQGRPPVNGHAWLPSPTMGIFSDNASVRGEEAGLRQIQLTWLVRLGTTAAEDGPGGWCYTSQGKQWEQRVPGSNPGAPTILGFAGRRGRA